MAKEYPGLKIDEIKKMMTKSVSPETIIAGKRKLSMFNRSLFPSHINKNVSLQDLNKVFFQQQQQQQQQNVSSSSSIVPKKKRRTTLNIKKKPRNEHQIIVEIARILSTHPNRSLEQEFSVTKSEDPVHLVRKLKKINIKLEYILDIVAKEYPNLKIEEINKLIKKPVST